jgi:hypothetical protein
MKAQQRNDNKRPFESMSGKGNGYSNGKGHYSGRGEGSSQSNSSYKKHTSNYSKGGKGHYGGKGYGKGNRHASNYSKSTHNSQYPSPYVPYSGYDSQGTWKTGGSHQGGGGSSSSGFSTPRNLTTDLDRMRVCRVLIANLNIDISNCAFQNQLVIIRISTYTDYISDDTRLETMITEANVAVSWEIIVKSRNK